MEVAENGVIPNGEIHSAPKKPASKKMTVEKVYQKKTQLEHILLRPDTYIGSVEHLTESMWVYNTETECIEQRKITYVPGLYKIFDEILVNAADNKQRDKNMNCIKVEIDAESNTISVWNNGQGIPVVEHKDEKMFVPTMIFGHLLTSSNYNDEEEKVTGGRNGYGAKLCNIFSSKFTVETASIEYKRSFKQVWAANMTKTSEPKIKEFFGSDYTKITFSPDLSKFRMEKLDKDIVDLLSRRAFDVAASTRGVKIYLNGKCLPVKNFKNYIELYLKDKEDEKGNPMPIIYESCNERWEVAVTISESGVFQQMSFVNSIATTKGGRHVDYVAEMIVKQLAKTYAKKNKSGLAMKNAQVKAHLWLFINCLITNPTFDSQTKENMTLQVKNFGSKCELSQKFFNQVMKSSIYEKITAVAQGKAENQLQKVSGKKLSKLKGIPKLVDANDAGTVKSLDCTLILTEGDSAKSFAVSGLGVVGRDKYGVFPLKGKMLNVREANVKQVSGNSEINLIIKILGLQYKKIYESMNDLKTLRYGRVMIMTDQDQDGSHIKGLLINFIHHNWPSLLKLPFLEEFITPIVKASKGNEEISFYSMPEFEQWKTENENWHKYKIKYYKGLGTSTSKEAKEYFSNLARHRIKFKYAGPQDDVHIKMAFSKKCVEERKEWLTNWMEESKQRRELGLPEQYLYEKDTHQINYTDFVNKELVLFSNLDNERSIPSLVDGLKPGQRKVLYTCLKRNDKREIKVAQLAGSVAEHSAYHHGEASLMSTIINLAQNFVGSNNINLLQPIGQFGTRLSGGKDAASPRYIFTMLSPLARSIFHPHDEPLLTHQYDDNKKIEPVWYIPVIPMVLVNGADGIGTGWMTKIPNYNPREIIDNLKRMLDGEEPKEMTPWYKNFRGTIEKLSYQRYVVYGEVGVVGDDTVEITELPIGVWTQTYKESVLELMLGAEKTPPQISDFKDYNTDTLVKFIVRMNAEKLRQAEADGLHKFFKLQVTFTTSSMCVFDSNSVMRKFENVEDILKEFYKLRLEFYVKRKAYLEGMLNAESLKLSNQARFILEKCSGELVVENKKKKIMIEELKKRGYEKDPVKQWKMKQDKESALAEAQEQAEDTEDSQTEEDQDKQSTDDYNYLLGMSMWSLTHERKEELLRNRDQKLHELKTLREKKPATLWREDLDALLEELDRVEAQELEEQSFSGGKKAGKLGKKPAGTQGKGKKAVAVSVDVMPSPMSRRILPKANDELIKKFEKAAVAKVKKIAKKTKVVGEKDEFDMMADAEIKTLEQRIGTSPEMVKKKVAGKKKDPSKPRGEGSPKKGKKKYEWESDDDSDSGKKKKGKRKRDDDDSFDESAGSDLDSYVPPARTVSRRSVAVSKKYTFDSDEEEEEDDDDELQLHDNDIDDDHVPVNDAALDLDDTQERNVIEVSDTDSDFDAPNPKSKAKSKKAAVSLDTSESMFDSLVGSGSKEVEPIPKKKAAPKKKLWQQEDGAQPAAKKAPVKRKHAKKQDSSDEDSDESFAAKRKKSSKKAATSASDSEPTEVAPRKQASARARKPVKYNYVDDDDEDEENNDDDTDSY